MAHPVLLFISRRFFSPAFLAILIFLLGLGLRLYQIGKVSLWYDEAGQAMAALAPTLQGTLDAVRSHASAMPLDYLVTRAMAAISLNEGWLRLPSALWGSLTLLVVYFLAKRLIDQRAALLAMALLALAPIHVQYSQELRFHAAGGFFYLLATLLLWVALTRNRVRDWVGLVLVTVLGGYFFPYVPLALCNGLIWLVTGLRPNPQFRSVSRRFVISAATVSALFLPGFLTLRLITWADYAPDFRQAINAVVRGLGWVPMVSGAANFSYLWGELLFLLGLAGTIIAIRERSRHLLALTVSGLLQVMAIFSSDLLSGYFIAGRQFLHLLPVSLLFVSLALSRWMDSGKLLFQVKSQTIEVGKIKRLNRGLAIMLSILLLISGVYALKEYYNGTKSLGAEISHVLSLEWQPGDKIWVIPPYETLLYRYYLEKRMAVTTLTSSFEGKQIETLSRPSAGQRTFLITPAEWPISSFDRVEQLDFRPFRIEGWGTDAQILWLFRPE